MGVNDVTRSVNGVEALAAMEAVGGIDTFDIVLMDLHMPLVRHGRGGVQGE